MGIKSFTHPHFGVGGRVPGDRSQDLLHGECYALAPPVL